MVFVLFKTQLCSQINFKLISYNIIFFTYTILYTLIIQFLRSFQHLNSKPKQIKIQTGRALNAFLMGKHPKKFSDHGRWILFNTRLTSQLSAWDYGTLSQQTS